jgi:hypothetical protein
LHGPTCWCRFSGHDVCINKERTAYLVGGIFLTARSAHGGRRLPPAPTSRAASSSRGCGRSERRRWPRSVCPRRVPARLGSLCPFNQNEEKQTGSGSFQGGYDVALWPVGVTGMVDIPVERSPRAPNERTALSCVLVLNSKCARRWCWGAVDTNARSLV